MPPISTFNYTHSIILIQIICIYHYFIMELLLIIKFIPLPQDNIILFFCHIPMVLKEEIFMHYILNFMDLLLIPQVGILFNKIKIPIQTILIGMIFYQMQILIKLYSDIIR